nr:hypothetical protein [Tanacetum cinerariifolium]
ARTKRARLGPAPRPVLASSWPATSSVAGLLHDQSTHESVYRVSGSSGLPLQCWHRPRYSPATAPERAG